MNIFFDQDGCLAEYCPELYKYYQKVFVASLPPIHGGVYLINHCLSVAPKDVYVITRLIDSPYMREEKVEWLHRYVPRLKESHIFLVPHDKSKVEYLKETKIDLSGMNFLVDDYQPNLEDWEKQGENFIGIKALNGRNSKKKWDGYTISVI